MRGTGRRRRLTLGDERGTALLMGLVLVMVMTLLGVALFEMSTIEASFARNDVADMQAFYCAEAEAARIYNLYAPGNDPTAALPSQNFSATLTLADETYPFSGSAVVDPDKLPTHLPCAFGKWYQGEGHERCGHLSHFREIDAPHARVHELGKQAIAAFNNGDKLKARKLCTEMVSNSEALMGHLDELSRNCK